MAQEVTIYTDPTVTITTARAILDGTTYAVANVTSVRAWTVKKSGSALMFGVIMLVIAVAVGASSVPWGLVVAVAAGFGFLIHFILKDRHFVRIGTAGAEHDAIWSHDLAYIRGIVDALNNAIVQRGLR